mmetsp:Transcript_12722/g.34876  ORF Transcript_12722/g.34876 Transcript_12722/m.34876 type:complete len:203 (-) Transcript_12722:64-672(-)
MTRSCLAAECGWLRARRRRGRLWPGGARRSASTSRHPRRHAPTRCRASVASSGRPRNAAGGPLTALASSPRLRTAARSEGSRSAPRCARRRPARRRQPPRRRAVCALRGGCRGFRDWRGSSAGSRPPTCSTVCAARAPAADCCNGQQARRTSRPRHKRHRARRPHRLRAAPAPAPGSAGRLRMRAAMTGAPSHRDPLTTSRA